MSWGNLLALADAYAPPFSRRRHSFGFCFENKKVVTVATALLDVAVVCTTAVAMIFFSPTHNNTRAFLSLMLLLLLL